jgi:AraC-like DNA-binding protein
MELGMVKDISQYYYQQMPDQDFSVDICRKIHNQPGPLFKPHWHEHLQFFRFHQGKATIRCNSASFLAVPTDIVIINSNELHYAENLGGVLSYDLIRVDFSFLFSHQWDSCQAKFLIPLSQNLISFTNLLHDPAVLECIDRTVAEYATRKIGYELAVKSALYQLIALLIRGYLKKIYTQKELEAQINQLHRFDSTLKYIDANFDQKIKISTLAEEVNLSECHFCRLFRQTIGKSPIEYLNMLRIQKAIGLLRETTLNITEIAFACGFSDANYFSRIFKKRQNLSPVAMRKSFFQSNRCDGEDNPKISSVD